MRVLILSDGKLEEKRIDNTLEKLQKIVGGYIEIPYLSIIFADNFIDVIVNDEGKFIYGLHPEIAVIKGNQVLDIVYGNCVFVSHDREGNTTELNDEQIQIIKEELKNDIVLYDRNTDKDILIKALFV